MSSLTAAEPSSSSVFSLGDASATITPGIQSLADTLENAENVVSSSKGIIPSLKPSNDVANFGILVAIFVAIIYVQRQRLFELEAYVSRYYHKEQRARAKARARQAREADAEAENFEGEFERHTAPVTRQRVEHVPNTMETQSAPLPKRKTTLRSGLGTIQGPKTQERPVNREGGYPERPGGSLGWLAVPAPSYPSYHWGPRLLYCLAMSIYIYLDVFQWKVLAGLTVTALVAFIEFFFKPHVYDRFGWEWEHHPDQ